jgi:hypothetical protein
LAEESVFTDEFLRQLINVGEADILVGVPTYNNAATVGQVVQTVRAGLLNSFPRERAVIVNADGGSRDGTQDLVRDASVSDQRSVADLHSLRTLHCISAKYEGPQSSGTALRSILAAAELLRASACAVIAADSTNLEPEWIERLLRPVYRDSVDLVMPVYSRHKFDGLLLSTLIYPMTRALYGKSIREPYATEFAFSSRLASQFGAQNVWQNEASREGAEICFTVAAMTGDFRLAQTFLGSKSHGDSGGADLVAALRQTVGALFWSMEANVKTWSASHEVQPVPLLQPGREVTVEPLRVNRKRLHQMFCSGVAELEPVLQTILSPGTLADLQRIAALAEDDFQYSDELWVRTVYEFAVSYHKSVMNRDHILQALAPLYRGKTYTFLAENRDASGDEVDESVERLCVTFEQSKPLLVELWK